MEECKMIKVFADSEEKYLMKVVVYATGDNEVMKYAKDGAEVSFEDAKDLASKGLLVVNVNDVYQEVVGYKVNSNHFEVYCLDMSDAATKQTYKSANKVA